MTITTIGLDVAKNAFQVRGADATDSDHGLVETKAGATPCLPSGAIYMQVATSHPPLETVLRELGRQARETRDRRRVGPRQGPPREPDGRR